jgi:hypothetical protein
LALALGFVTLPLFTVGGAIAGVLVYRNWGERWVAAGTMAALLAMMAVMGLTPDMTGTPSPSSVIDPPGCRNYPRDTFPGRESVVDVFDRVCDGRRTLDVSVRPAGDSGGSTGPGNALVLRGTYESGFVRLAVTAAEQADSTLTITYDHRAEVVSQRDRIGHWRLRIVPDSVAMARTAFVAPPVAVPEPAPAAPVANPATAVATGRMGPEYHGFVPTPSHGVNGITLPDVLTPVASPGCVLEPRAWRKQPTWGSTIYKRTCAGESPVVEAIVVPLTDGRASGPPVRVFALDASMETPDHRVAVDFPPGSTSLEFRYDARARLALLVPRVGSITVTAVADTLPESRR